MGYTGKKLVGVLENNAGLEQVVSKVNELVQAVALLQHNSQATNISDSKSTEKLENEINGLKHIIATEITSVRKLKQKTPEPQPQPSNVQKISSS